MHGGPTARRIQQLWGELLQAHEESLDPALHRLKQQGPSEMTGSARPE
jgi:hypothetical protein